MIVFEKTYYDALVRDMQTSLKLLEEAKEYSIVMQFNDTTGRLKDAEQFIIAAIGDIQRESGTITIDSHQELK